MVVDRFNRDRLIYAIDQYVGDQISAFEFNDQIFEIQDATTDETLKQVVDELWCYYDDCNDHHVKLNKPSWDYFQRLRLLLGSDANLDVSKRRLWSSTQIAAALALFGFIWCAIQTSGEHLFVVAFPFGIVSILLYRVRAGLMLCGQDENTLIPFTSVRQLMVVRRAIARFRKQRYPMVFASRCIRSPSAAVVNGMLMYVPWLLLSPLVLLAQMFPVTMKSYTVVLENDAAD